MVALRLICARLHFHTTRKNPGRQIQLTTQGRQTTGCNEEVLPTNDQPEFLSLKLLAARGLSAPDTWECKRAQVSLKATIDVPMLGTIMSKMVMDSLKTPTCPWDGHCTLMVLSDNVVFIEPLACKN